MKLIFFISQFAQSRKMHFFRGKYCVKKQFSQEIPLKRNIFKKHTMRAINEWLNPMLVFMESCLWKVFTAPMMSLVYFILSRVTAFSFIQSPISRGLQQHYLMCKYTESWSCCTATLYEQLSSYLLYFFLFFFFCFGDQFIIYSEMTKNLYKSVQ